MIKLSNLSLRQGATTLLDQASATIFPNHKVGLVGANGCGKSSLFSALRGELSPDSGEIEYPTAWVTSHMAQQITDLAQTAIDFVLDGDQALREAERQVDMAQQGSGGSESAQAHTIAAAHEALATAGGYDAHARAARLLAGLGFEATQFNQPIATFSGGWRIRLSLAKALMAPADLLLLDEPTNHLDLETVAWLESWLKHYPGTLIVISHDRDFLDSVVDSIIHFDQRGLTTYTGTYSQFEQQRMVRLNQQQASFVKQQKSIAHMQRFIDRFRAKASKAKAAQSRLKALDRLERIAPAHIDSPFSFEFYEPPKCANPLVHLDQVALGYENTVVLSQLSASITPGDRIGLLGLNGAGKSTLIKAMADTLSPLSGQLQRARGLTIGYFAQHQLEQLDSQASAVQHLAAQDERLGIVSSDQALRDFLGGFGFGGDQADASVNQFSGGEKARLVLALLVRQKPNLLLLDEPSNHLDLEMRHALTVALQSFEGAVMVVSHDRHLLNNSVDQFWLIHDGTLSMFDGDLDDYRALIKKRVKDIEPSQGGTPSKKNERHIRANLREQLKPLQNKLKKLSQKVETLTAEVKALDEALADPTRYQDPHSGEETALMMKKRLGQKNLLEATEVEWLEVAEQIEALEESANNL